MPACGGHVGEHRPGIGVAAEIAATADERQHADAQQQSHCSDPFTDAFVIVNRLPLVVVFGLLPAPPLGDRLRRFVRLKAAEELLLARGRGLVAQAAVAEHHRVVHLHVFGIHGADLLQHLPPPPRIALQEQDARRSG